MQPELPRRPRPCGFTLVELLVVIGVIAVLIGILMPALTKARKQAVRTACLSNVRQLMAGATAYMVENKGRFPYQSAAVVNSVPWLDDSHSKWKPNWAYTLHRFLKNQPVFLCPASERINLNTPRSEHISYFANGVVTNFGGQKFKRSTEVAAIADEEMTYGGAAIRPFPYTTDSKRWETDAVWAGWMRFGNGELISDGPHDGGRVYGYLDGHADWKHWRDVTSRTFGLMIQGDYKQEANLSGYTSPLRAGTIVWR